MLDGIFIDAPTREGFLSMLNGGEVDKASIAFIKDTKEIWTQGVFYNCSGLTAQEITNLVQNYLAQHPGIEESDVINIIKNQVAEWSLKSNTSTIPINKLPNSLVRIGIVDPINNTFYSKGMEDPTSGNLYIDQTNYKCYIYLSGQFKQVGGTDFDPSSLNLATIATTGKLSDGIDDYDHKLVTQDQINSWEAKVDWNAAEGTDSEILNKPTLVDTIKINGSSKKPTTNKKNEIDLGNVVQSIKLNNSTLSPTSGQVDLGNIITSAALNNYYTKTDIDNKHYLTKQQPADWTAKEGTDTSILNKPQIGSGQINFIYKNPNSTDQEILDIGSFQLNGNYQENSQNIDFSGIINAILTKVQDIYDNLDARVSSLETCSECALDGPIHKFYFGQNATALNSSNYINKLNSDEAVDEIPAQYTTTIYERIDILLPKTMEDNGQLKELDQVNIIDSTGWTLEMRDPVEIGDNYVYYRSKGQADNTFTLQITYKNKND